MSLYDKRLQREELSDRLDFLTVEDRDRVLAELDKVSKRYDISRRRQDGDDVDSMELLEHYITAKRVQGCTPATLEHYRYVLIQMYEQIGLPFTQITHEDIMDLFARLETEFLLSARTRSGYRSVYRTFFLWLQDEEFIIKNPMLRVPPIKYPKTVKVPYTPADLAKLEEATWNPAGSRDLAIIHFLRSTACRIKEMCQLNRDDIDLTNRRAIVDGKGAKERYILFDEKTAYYLMAYLLERDDDLPALFIGKGTDRMSPGGVRRMLSRLAKQADVDHVHPHRFRRTQATSLLRKGMKLEKVSKLLGHAKLDTTMGYIYMDAEEIAADYRKYA